MSPATKEVQEQIEIEKRGLAIVHAALSDEQFVAGVLEAHKMEMNGEQGKPWSEVKAELKIS